MSDLHAPDTDELLRRCTHGDPLATAQLLDRHRDRSRRMVTVRLPSTCKSSAADHDIRTLTDIDQILTQPH
jgi:hypothetical protein